MLTLIFISQISCKDSSARFFTCEDNKSIEDSVEMLELAQFGYGELRELRIPNTTLTGGLKIKKYAIRDVWAVS